jgi:hypothetical protein
VPVMKVRTLLVSAALVASMSMVAPVSLQAQYYNAPSYNGYSSQYLPQPRSTPPQLLPQQQQFEQFNPPPHYQPPPIGGYFGGCYTRQLGGGMSACQ